LRFLRFAFAFVFVLEFVFSSSYSRARVSGFVFSFAGNWRAFGEDRPASFLWRGFGEGVFGPCV
jgi:hypothetical protein